MMSQSVQDLMTSQPRVCTPAESVIEVARTMRDADIGSLPVVESADSPKLLGMITDRDIVCRILAEGADPGSARVEQAMSCEVASVSEEGTVDEVVRLMAEHQVRRIPVVDAQGRVVGIVAQADLATASKQQGDLEDELAEVVEEVSEPTTTARAE